MTTQTSHDQAGPSGFGGWLTLVAIGQTLGPIITIGGVVGSIAAYRQMMMLPGGAMAVYGEVALNVAFLFIQLVCVRAMYRRSKKCPRLFLLQWIAVILLAVGDVLLVSVALNLPLSTVLGFIKPIRIIGPIVITGIWVLYMFESVRVRNTFTQ